MFTTTMKTITHLYYVHEAGFPHFFTFKFKDFSRLNKWFSRSRQCKIPGLFQVKLMFFVAQKLKLIRIMYLHIARTCKLLWNALYIAAYFSIFKSSSVFTHIYNYGCKHVLAYAALQTVETQIRQVPARYFKKNDFEKKISRCKKACIPEMTSL